MIDSWESKHATSGHGEINITGRPRLGNQCADIHLHNMGWEQDNELSVSYWMRHVAYEEIDEYTVPLHALQKHTGLHNYESIWCIPLKMDYNGIMISGCVAVFVQEMCNDY